MKCTSMVSATALILAGAGLASAGVMDNDPANDVQAGADTVNLVDNSASYGANLISGQFGDVDWFTFSAPANSVITIVVIPLADPLLRPDTILGLFDAGGDLLNFNDDGGFPDFLGSFLTYETTNATDLWFAISGFGDAEDFDGSHDETGSYVVKISATLIPTPGALAIAGLAGLAATRRRR